MLISVKASQGPVRDQHDRPTCVAFAVTALHEHLHLVRTGLDKTVDLDLSEEFLYYHCKQRDGLGVKSTGTTISAASGSLAKQGQSLEALCPYQLRPHAPRSKLTPPAPAALADGRTRLLSGLTRLPQSLASVRRSLKAGMPVVAVLDLHSNAYLTVAGQIELPRPGDRPIGRHAVLIVELEDRSGEPCRIFFKNSWGSKWGDKGFGSLREDYFKAHGRELWGIPW